MGASSVGESPTRFVARAERKRAYGSGSVIEQSGAFYGKWRINGRQVMRKLGPCRRPGTRDGLSRAQAEARLRQLMTQTVLPPSPERLTFDEVGQLYLQHLEDVMQRKRTTIQDYRIMLRLHLGPYFGSTYIAKLTPRTSTRTSPTSAAAGSQSRRSSTISTSPTASSRSPSSAGW